MTTTTILLEGMPGEPLPYLLHSDGMVTTIIYLSFLLLSFVFSRHKKHLHYGLKNFANNRKRNSIFDEVTTADMRYTVLLVLHTSVMLGICVYHYSSNTTPALFSTLSHPLLLGGFIGAFILLILFKWGIYSFIHWTFFQKERNTLWTMSFFNLYIWLGILLLPLISWIVYFDISSTWAVICVGFLIVLSKIFLFWKTFSIFFEKIYGSFHLILYFCALEIIPDLILWKGIEMISSILTLNL